MKPLYSLQILSGTWIILGKVVGKCDWTCSLMVFVFAIITIINLIIEVEKPKSLGG